MVPVALRPTRDTTRPCRLWSDPRFGWNCPALPPPVGRARASVVDEPGRGDTWQRAPLVLSRRRFRYALKRARALVARLEEEPHANPNTRTQEFSLRAGIRTDTTSPLVRSLRSSWGATSRRPK